MQKVDIYLSQERDGDRARNFFDHRDRANLIRPDKF